MIWVTLCDTDLDFYGYICIHSCLHMHGHLRNERLIGGIGLSLHILRDQISSSMKWSPPLFSGLPATIRALVSRAPACTTDITVQGWIKSVRQHKNVSFAAISDGTTSQSIQAVFKGDVNAEQYVQIHELGLPIH